MLFYKTSISSFIKFLRKKSREKSMDSEEEVACTDYSRSRLVRDRSNNRILAFIFNDQGTIVCKQREMEPEAKTEETGKKNNR